MRGEGSGQASAARRGSPARFMLAHLLIGSLAVAAPARPDAREIDRCAAAFEQGQVQRKERHLLEARSSFEVCARPVCPGAVSKMCARWLDEVRALVPRLRVSAAGGAPGTIVVDGRPSGAAPATIEVDPGPHRLALRTERGDGPAATIEASASPEPSPVELAAPAPLLAPSASASAAPPVSGTSGPRTAGYITLGLGLVAVGAGAWVGLAARSEASDRRERCAQGDCSSGSDRDRLRARLGLADALMGVGAVASGVGLYLLLRPDTSVTVASRPGGAAATATFRF